MGRVSAPFGVQGWIKIQPFTESIDSLSQYSNWWIGRDGDYKVCRVEQSTAHGKSLLAQLENCGDRDVAAALKGCDVAIPREELPEVASGEYYWHDLIDCEVVNTKGVALGVVKNILETGSNAVLVVKGERERLLPFIESVVTNVDVSGARITVDWESDS